VARALERFPVLILAGGALLGWVAGETAVSDPAIRDWIANQAPWLATAAAPATAVYCLAHGRLERLRRARSASRPVR
jgi:predicted tellurium resistance membrane protein TerC